MIPLASKTSVKVLKRRGIWVVRVVEDYRTTAIRAFAIKRHALSFAEGQAARLDLSRAKNGQFRRDPEPKPAIVLSK